MLLRGITKHVIDFTIVLNSTAKGITRTGLEKRERQKTGASEPTAEDLHKLAWISFGRAEK